jgi:hypothetical protein
VAAGPREQAAFDTQVEQLRTQIAQLKEQQRAREQQERDAEELSKINKEVSRAREEIVRAQEAAGVRIAASVSSQTAAGAGPVRGLETGSGRPSFQHGGIVPGPIGAPQVIVAHGGERVETIEQQWSRPARPAVNVTVVMAGPTMVRSARDFYDLAGAIGGMVSDRVRRNM